MNLKTSFCNKSVIKSNFKRLWWIPALHTILMFLTGTMIFLTGYYEQNIYNPIGNADYLKRNLVSYLSSYYVLAIVVPVALGVMLFSYMQKSKSSTFAHSLPVSRGALYASHILSGVIMYTIPLIVNALILLLFRIDGGFAAIFDVKHLLSLMWEVFLYSTVTFSGACCISFISGNAVASCIFTYIFGFLPAVAEVFIQFFASTQLFGYEYNYNYSVSKFLYVPPIQLSRWTNSLLYVIIAALLFALGYILYRLRNIENHSEVVAFPKLRPIFVYGVGICSGCLGFAYFSGLWDINNALLLIPIGILGIIIAQMIVKKSFRIPEVYKPIIGYTIIILAVFAVFNFDLTGYEKRIPDAEEVEYVTFSNSNINYDYTVYTDSSGTDYSHENYYSPDIKSKEGIKDVTALHRYLVLNKNAKYNSYDTISLMYKLKNGKTLNRSYNIDLKVHKEKLEPIVESDVVRQMYFPILRNDNRKIKSISVMDSRLSSENFKDIYPDSSDFERLIKALKKDLAAADYEEYVYRNATFTYLNISFTRPGRYIDGRKVDETELTVENETYYIRDSYTNTIAVLREIGFMDALPVTGDVSKIYVDYYNSGDRYIYSEDGAAYNKEITDTDDIESVMNYIDTAGRSVYDYAQACVTVKLKDGRCYSSEVRLDDENLPDCLKK